MARRTVTTLDPAEARALVEGTHGDPFAVLGPHAAGKGHLLRVCLPGAIGVEAIEREGGRLLAELSPGPAEGLFEAPLGRHVPYRLRIRWPGAVQETEDPYSFGPLLGELDLYLIAEGRHFQLSDALGASCQTIDGVPGLRFAVWAPNASRVAVIGDFNAWDERRHPMRLRREAGVWEIFIPRARPGDRYKYAIRARDGTRLTAKADPLARETERPPSTASVAPGPMAHEWRDREWMARRQAAQQADAPISIYEVHVGSWMAPRGGEAAEPLWRRLARTLIPYVGDMGFTHIELLPVTEHPFGGSWGYQPLGLFAPSARYGSPDDLAAFIDACHRAGIGVLLDWVPAHFPTDAHGLARFDGTALYEHLDPHQGFHRDWNTLIYNFGRHEVQGFLIASALFWLEKFHVDGLRVDAVASMLYRDYSRAAGEWTPNIHGGRENLEAVDFLRRLNEAVAERCPGAIMVAEESTAWPGVTRPVRDGGLGFSYKWNMGWMNDTLRYMSRDPIHRKWHHDDLTFGLVYAFSEKFILPLSHDEVVHGKGSLIGRMPGDDWRRFANLRAYFGFMWAHPGKKLLFMGGEIAQMREWNHEAEIDWPLADDPRHDGVRRLVRDLNILHRREPALHQRDADPEGFRWLIGDDRMNSVFAFLRLGAAGTPPVLVLVNMTPAPLENYCVGAPLRGRWSELLNTDAAVYGGSNMGNGGSVEALAAPAHGQPCSIRATVPPLAAIILKHEG